ncbi:MAG: hypothetical protein VCF25_26760 [Candidatus Poribacteria bacterium]|jgi:hypothetical protein
MSNKMLSIAIAMVVATFFICANEARAKVVTNGLVSYWTCDKADTKGDVLKDAWGENHENRTC